MRKKGKGLRFEGRGLKNAVRVKRRKEAHGHGTAGFSAVCLRQSHGVNRLNTRERRVALTRTSELLPRFHAIRPEDQIPSPVSWFPSFQILRSEDQIPLSSFPGSHSLQILRSEDQIPPLVFWFPSFQILRREDQIPLPSFLVHLVSSFPTGL